MDVDPSLRRPLSHPHGADEPDRAVLGALRARSTRGALVSVGGQALSQILRLGGNLILARLLYPEAFGLMALVNLLMLGLQAVSDVGVQPALIRHHRGDDRRFLDTAWTLQASRGALLWLVGSLAALPMALFYREPALSSLVPVACLGVLVTGLSSTKLATYTRRMAPSRIVAIEVGSQAAALGVLVALAFVWRSVWVLVIGGLVAATLRCVLSHVVLGGAMNRPAWDRAAARELIAFGRWILVSTALTFVALRVDIALLGRLLPVEVLGVYSIGIVLPTAVRDVLGQIGRFVVLPALSVSQRAGSDVLVANYLRMQRMSAPAAVLGLTAAAFAAPAFFIFLYDDRYHAAAWIAQLALAGTWFSYLAEVGGAALVAIGDSRAWALCTALRAVVMTVGCALGFAVGALPGLILGSGAASCVTYLFTGRQLARHGVRTLATDLRYTALGAVLAAGAGWLPHLAGDPSPRATALRSLLLGAALLAPLAVWVMLRLRRTRRGA